MVSIAYAPVNYIATIYRGKPVYLFITWTDYKSVVAIVVIASFLILTFRLVCWVTEITKS